MSVTAIRLEMDTEQMQKIFGMQDAYIKKLEQDFQVTICLLYTSPSPRDCS